MKYHFVYFIIIPILLLIAMMLPLQIMPQMAGGDAPTVMYDAVIITYFLLPTIVATILLLIRNHITAVIGTCIYVLTLGFAGFMNYTLNFSLLAKNLGSGPAAIFIVLLIAVIFSLIHTIKLVKTRKNKGKDQEELLDTF